MEGGPISGGAVELVEPGGRRIALQLDGGSAPLRYLHDVVVTVEGSRVGRRFLVRDWRVVDAGDGSSGYVGQLRVQGMRVFLADRNSGGLVVLDDRTSAPLRAWDGRTVLVIGYLVGPETVQPVAWRLLEAE